MPEDELENYFLAEYARKYIEKEAKKRAPEVAEMLKKQIRQLEEVIQAYRLDDVSLPLGYGPLELRILEILELHDSMTLAGIVNACQGYIWTIADVKSALSRLIEQGKVRYNSEYDDYSVV